MQIGNSAYFHLTYCTNIHPGETWSEVDANLKRYLPPLKASLFPDRPFGVGLRLSDRASRELLRDDNLEAFKTWLDGQELYVFTLNGFPYGGFHRQVVKDRVYAPDWSKPERLDYTVRLARILAFLLPEGTDGGISTVPLSYKPWWKTEAERKAVLRDSCLNLGKVVLELAQIRRETGKQLHLDLEPEPDGLIENTDETVALFDDWLDPMAEEVLAAPLQCSPAEAKAELRDRLRLCYDTCHFAVEYEDPVAACDRLREAGIKIGKVQLSAAVRFAIPASPADRKQLRDRLSPFAESTYLHQAIVRHPDGSLRRYRDLSEALPDLDKTPAEEWRTHFHVPIFIEDYRGLSSTQNDIVTVLKLLRERPLCTHLEIETYTWDILPTTMKLDVLASIRREYEWVLEELGCGV